MTKPATALGWVRPASATLLLVGMVGCGSTNVFQEPPPPEVIVTKPVIQKVTTYIEQTGTAQASKSVELRSRVSGYLKEINFKDGDLVEKDQLLFVIDEEPFSEKLKFAQAKSSEAKAKLERAKQSKAREIAKANLDLAKAELELADSSHKRNAALVSRMAASQEQYDQSEAALQKAAAQALAAKSELDQAESEFTTNILSAEAALAIAESEVHTAEIDLGFCRIKAPRDGRIDRRAVDIGNYIAMDGSSVLATIVQVDPIYAYVAINQNDLVRLKNLNKGADLVDSLPVTVRVDESQSAPLDGKIDYIAPSFHKGTGTVQIRGVFDNPGAISPGMFVRIRIPAEVIEKAILVPERSLGYDQVGAYVYVVNGENTIERRSVTPGETLNGSRVITGNLVEGEQIVADGLLKVRHNMRVTVKTLEERQEAKAAARQQPAAEHSTTTSGHGDL